MDKLKKAIKYMTEKPNDEHIDLLITRFEEAKSTDHEEFTQEAFKVIRLLLPKRNGRLKLANMYHMASGEKEFKEG